jgi:hypothetical protein
MYARRTNNKARRVLAKQKRDTDTAKIDTIPKVEPIKSARLEGILEGKMMNKIMDNPKKICAHLFKLKDFIIIIYTLLS